MVLLLILDCALTALFALSSFLNRRRARELEQKLRISNVRNERLRAYATSTLNIQGQPHGTSAGILEIVRAAAPAGVDFDRVMQELNTAYEWEKREAASRPS